MRNKILRVCTAVCLCTLINVKATDLVVDPDGLMGMYRTIQAAVDVATSGDSILLAAGRTFTGVGNYNITIDKNLTFDRAGTGADPVIDLNMSGRLCTINSGKTVSIRNLNIQNGKTSSNGGAIYNNGILNLSCDL